MGEAEVVVVEVVVVAGDEDIISGDVIIKLCTSSRKLFIAVHTKCTWLPVLFINVHTKCTWLPVHTKCTGLPVLFITVLGLPEVFIVNYVAIWLAYTVPHCHLDC